MQSIKKSILFVDWVPSLEKVHIQEPSENLYFFDPNKIAGSTDWWTRFDEDLPTLNKVYGELFDEIVIKGKTLVCFWPNVAFSPSQKYDLTQIFSNTNLKMSLYVKDGRAPQYNFSFDQLEAWKEFVMTLIESLSEDLSMNEGLEEVMSLKSAQQQIDILKLSEKGEIRFVYFITAMDDYSHPTPLDDTNSFDTFANLANELLSKHKISNFSLTFHRREFEKEFYKVMLDGNAAPNLVLAWENLFSTN